MRSTHGSEDLTAAARIRSAAIDEVASVGRKSASLRAIAARANVSPGLIAHHFGSKAGLLKAADERVVQYFSTAVDNMVSEGAALTANWFAEAFGSEPAMLPYFAEAMLDSSKTGEAMFDRLLMVTTEAMNTMEELGHVSQTTDPLVRNLFVMIADLGVFMLRHHIERHIGADLTVPESLQRWSEAVFEIYSNGMFTGAAHESPNS